tara:strand:- start:910 stop:1455 length:546 start_codon:yes stop_codon:yes gene_type:complete
MDYRNRYPAFIKMLSRLIDLFLVCGGICVLTLIFANAVLRGAAGFDLAWSLEVTAFLLLWLTFLGCAAAAARGAHMRVTEVVSYLVPDRLKPVLEFIISISIAVLLISLIFQGFQIAQHTWAQRTTVLYWPVGLLYASLPVGMALTFIFHLANTIFDVRDGFNPPGDPFRKSDDPAWKDFE